MVTDLVVELDAGKTDQAFTLSTLQELFLVHQRVLTFKAGGGLTFGDVCSRPAPSFPCNAGTIFDIAGITSLDQLNTTADSLALSQAVASSPLLDTLVSGGVVVNGSLVSAAGLSFFYIASDLLSDSAKSDEWIVSVADLLRDIYSRSLASSDPFQIYPYNRQIIEEDTREVVQRQYPLMAIAVLLILGYLALVLGNKPMLKRSR